MSNRTIQIGMALIALVASLGFAQTVHQLPFASTGNLIELTIANISSVPAANVEVRMENVPAWLKVGAGKQQLDRTEAHSEAVAVFSFSVDKSAPVHEQHTLLFLITTPSGETWTKEITISVNPPDHFELFQNYPNPFNPTTTISYQLPTAAHVTLKVYNLLAQEVATLITANQPAGYHRVQWDGAQQASGVYLYQLVAQDDASKRTVLHRAMVLAK